MSHSVPCGYLARSGPQLGAREASPTVNVLCTCSATSIRSQRGILNLRLWVKSRGMILSQRPHSHVAVADGSVVYMAVGESIRFDPFVLINRTGPVCLEDLLIQTCYESTLSRYPKRMCTL